MASLSALAPITSGVTSLSNLILVSPQSTIGYQPQNPPLPDGSPSTLALPPSLLFHYEGEQTVMLESDITDHFVEDNTAVQDQIAIRPEMITTHGFIGELNNVAPYGLQTVHAAVQKLLSIAAYTPDLSITALNAYNEALLLYQTGLNAANAATATMSSINGNDGENVISASGLGSAFNASTGKVAGNQTKQQVAFQQFYGYWRARTLFTVQTPWAVFKNMAIKSLRAIQSEDTNQITDFEVSFKMIRSASTKLIGGVSENGTSTPVSSQGVKSAISSNLPGVFSGLP